MRVPNRGSFKPIPVNQRFWNKATQPAEGCWEWQAKREKSGYGAVKVNGLTEKAHRVAWALTYGPIPPKMLVCHRCDNRRCVRPDHLFLGTHKDNTCDAAEKGRHVRGERVTISKLTTPQVLDIRRDFANGVRQRVLARRYGVTDRSIKLVVERQTWRHV